MSNRPSIDTTIEDMWRAFLTTIGGPHEFSPQTVRWVHAVFLAGNASMYELLYGVQPGEHSEAEVEAYRNRLNAELKRFAATAATDLMLQRKEQGEAN